MLRSARAHVPTAARCIDAALRGDPSPQERAVVAGLVAHFIDDVSALRRAYVKDS